MDHTLALIMKSQQGDKEARDTVFKRRAGIQHGEKICRARRGNGRYRTDREHWSA